MYCASLNLFTISFQLVEPSTFSLLPIFLPVSKHSFPPKKTKWRHSQGIPYPCIYITVPLLLCRNQYQSRSLSLLATYLLLLVVYSCHSFCIWLNIFSSYTFFPACTYCIPLLNTVLHFRALEEHRTANESHEQEMKRASILIKHAELKIFSLTDSVTKKDIEMKRLTTLLEDITGNMGAKR